MKIYIIKSECGEYEDYSVNNLLAVKSQIHAQSIVDSFNLAAKNHKIFRDEIGLFENEYKKDNPYPVLKTIKFPSGIGKYQNDQYMTVDDTYQEVVDEYKKGLTKVALQHHAACIKWNEDFKLICIDKFRFTFDEYLFPEILKRYEYNLYMYEFSYEELDME